MIVVFYANPIVLGAFGATFNTIQPRVAATAAAETTNIIEWLVN